MTRTTNRIEECAGKRLVTADVGGTYARLGVVELSAGAVSVVFHQRYTGADFPGLAAVLCQFRDDYAAQTQQVLPDVCVVAIAGVLQGDTLLNSNLPWKVSLAQTQRDAKISQLHFINDFEALAWALPQLSAQQLRPLSAGNGLGLQLPALLLGPGTGLGAALVIDHNGKPSVQPSEAGHAALAANSLLELDVVRLLQARFGHVDSERVFSGPGLMNLYQAVCELRDIAPRWSTPAELVEAVNEGRDALATECVSLFSRWLGSFAGDLVITFRARSICLAGGLTGHLQTYLQQGGFMQRFMDKGVLSDTLRDVPVFTIEHGQLGLIGAAAWYAVHQASD